MCTPAIRAFKKRFPECKLDFLTETPDVLKGNPYLNSTIEADISKKMSFQYQLRLISKIRGNKYDLVVDFLANPRSAYYSFFSGAETRLSYGFGHRRWAYNMVPSKSSQPIYAANDRLRLLEALDVKPDGPALDFFLSEKDREEACRLIENRDGRMLVTLSPVARRKIKRWPLVNYSALADMLVGELGAAVAILAGPGEDEIAQTVARGMRNEVQVPRVTSLGALGAILQMAALHIGNDNGPKHIAVACGAPTLTIFGSQSHMGWTYPDYARQRWVIPTESCEDCRQGRHKTGPKCILSIPAREVFDRARQMIEALNLGPHVYPRT
jgi:ADP-heptose:LPS heptosyltransferase